VEPLEPLVEVKPPVVVVVEPPIEVELPCPVTPWTLLASLSLIDVHVLALF
jgi:hypothetical protein